jgi:hypothetical protein
MATKVIHRRLSEAELNAPDLDDEGELDVETFPVPDAKDPALREAWEEAMRILNEDDQSADVQLSDLPDGPAETGSADPAVESILEKASPASVAAFAELRQRLGALVKKKRPTL